MDCRKKQIQTTARRESHAARMDVSIYGRLRPDAPIHTGVVENTQTGWIDECMKECMNQ